MHLNLKQPKFQDIQQNPKKYEGYKSTGDEDNDIPDPNASSNRNMSMAQLAQLLSNMDLDTMEQKKKDLKNERLNTDKHYGVFRLS